ncbi:MULTISPECIES: MbeB family mobilization protein [Photobacterium]|uniref:MbeB family mobilization protein n=1 Tax=Photobacterium TaxID=657 RepID=UPI001D13600D
MSKILDLAQDFERKSKEQANVTENNLKIEFNKHEKFIVEALKLSEQKIQKDIQDQTKRMSWLVIKNWVKVILFGIILIMIFVIITMWQTKKISENYQEIKNQNIALKKLEKSNISMQTVDGINYLILPKKALITDTYISKTNLAVITWTK